MQTNTFQWHHWALTNKNMCMKQVYQIVNRSTGLIFCLMFCGCHNRAHITTPSVCTLLSSKTCCYGVLLFFFNTFPLIKVLLLAEKWLLITLMFFIIVFTATLIPLFVFPLSPPSCIVTMEYYQRGGHSKYILRKENKPLMMLTLRCFCHLNVFMFLLR